MITMQLYLHGRRKVNKGFPGLEERKLLSNAYAASTRDNGNVLET